MNNAGLAGLTALGTFGIIMGLILILYSVWLLIFPLLLYGQVKALLSEFKNMNQKLTYFVKFSSYKEIYYCPKCLQLDKEKGKCPECNQDMQFKF